MEVKCPKCETVLSKVEALHAHHAEFDCGQCGQHFGLPMTPPEKPKPKPEPEHQKTGE